MQNVFYNLFYVQNYRRQCSSEIYYCEVIKLRFLLSRFGFENRSGDLTFGMKVHFLLDLTKRSSRTALQKRLLPSLNSFITTPLFSST